MSDAEEGTTVTVTSKGQATIPKEFREKLHIDTPGRVRFVETEDGEVVIRPVKRPAEIRGALASAVEADEPFPYDFAAGARGVRLTEAGHRSAEEGRRVVVGGVEA